MKLSKLVISNVVVLGATGNIRLNFKGLPSTIIAIKSKGLLFNSLTPTERIICDLDPSNLIGATLSAVAITGERPVEPIIMTFKKGDKYIATENNTEVKEGRAKVGDELTCQNDGLRIEGGIHLELHPEVKAEIAREIRSEAVKMQMEEQRKASAMKSVASRRLTDDFKAEVDPNEQEGEDPEKTIAGGIEGQA